MPRIKLRDRDSITTEEGLIFRVFGYSHPSNAYICDVEYAPSTIFQSCNPKALRNRGQNVFYKFYEDQGWKFLQDTLPQYLIFHEMLRKKTIGVNHRDIVGVRLPDERLQSLITSKPEDELIAATQNVLEIITQNSGLSLEDFGLFGSMLHGFHHPEYSDIDLIVHGKKNTAKLCGVLQELYKGCSAFTNEFETDKLVRGKRWAFQNYAPKEFTWHQRRKLNYTLFNDEKSGRIIKTEFEPVMNWKEINDEYDSRGRIIQKGWTRIIAKVTEDDDAPFIPSIYEIEPLETLEGPRQAIEACRIISYMEEFRMQVRKDETVYAEGNLEEVTTSKGHFHQITLTYCPRYYEQVLKIEPCTCSTPKS